MDCSSYPSITATALRCTTYRSGELSQINQSIDFHLLHSELLHTGLILLLSDWLEFVTEFSFSKALSVKFKTEYAKL